MKKLIVQHRRGTLSEWIHYDGIPSDGELLIEEHSDYSRIKIGDGVHTYEELDYIDGNVQAYMDYLDTRISNLTQSTVADDEIVDIRTGYNGLLHTTAGDAVRAIGNDLLDLRDSLDQFIDAKAVDGLLYENNILYLTTNGVPIVESGVEIVGGSGGGGGGSFYVKLTNLTPQGNNFYVTGSDKVNLSFLFVSTEDDVPTGDYTCKVIVNSVQQLSKSYTQNNTGVSIDVTEWLGADENTVQITCTDMYGNYRTLIYTINVINLTIESGFNGNVVYAQKDYSDGIDFRYITNGQIDRTVHFVLDSNEFATINMVASTSGRENRQNIPFKGHGCHRLQVYVTATSDNTTIYSNTLTYDIMMQGTGATAPMISSVYDVKEVESGSLVSIPYIVYDPNDNECEITLSITYIKDGKSETYKDPVTQTVDQSLQTWVTRDYPTSDNVTFTISYTEDGVTISKSHTLKVYESDFKVEAIEGPILYLTASGKTNSSTDRNKWEYNGITTTFNKFNWKSNGWLSDNIGDTCLSLSGGAQAIINFAPFSTDNFKIDNHGMTFEFVFKVTDVNNRDTTIFECYDSINNRGIRATADTAFIKSSADKVSCNYKDNEIVKLTFTVEKKGKQSNGKYDSGRFLSVYLNGTLSGILSFPETSQFNHDSLIVLGDAMGGCTLNLYSIRIYDMVLSHSNVVNNYIADINDLNEKKLVFNDNNIYNKSNLLSYEEVKKRIPTITFTGQMPTYKGDKRVVTMDFVNPFDHTKDFSTVYGGPIQVEIDVQGTSSQYYARKNWKFKLEQKKKDANGNTVKDANGKTVYNFKHAAYQHMDGEIPAKVFCIKVDYAESTGTHNTQNANYVETLYYEQIPGQTDTELGDERVRTTITGFPCVIYEKKTATSTPVFSSKGNFNYDKDAEEAFGFTEELNEKYGVECWEFCNNDSDNCNFLGEIDTNSCWLDNFEPRYTPFADEFEELEGFEDDIKENKTLNTSDTEKLNTYRHDIIYKFKQMHDWVCSTSGAVDKDNKVVDSTKLEKFSTEFEKYFDMHYSTIYYLYTFVALMTDQRAKNMFLTYWGHTTPVYSIEDGKWRLNGTLTNIDADETILPHIDGMFYYVGDVNTGITAGKWYPYFYDNDTSYGINNEGYLVFDYYHEDIDQVDNVNVYNGQLSTLWTNFRHAFTNRISSLYATLRSDGRISYNKIINQFIEEGSSKWSASIYNEDAEYKYITMARPENASTNVDLDPTDDVDETGKIVTSNLYQVRGDGESHLKYFVQNRIKYCDSKWNAGTYPNDYVLLRLNTPQVTAYPSDIIVSEKTISKDSSVTLYVVDKLAMNKQEVSDSVYDIDGNTLTLNVIDNTIVDSSGNELYSVYDSDGNNIKLIVIDGKICYDVRYTSLILQVKRQGDEDYTYTEELSIADLGYVNASYKAPINDTYTFSLLNMNNEVLGNDIYSIVEPGSEYEPGTPEYEMNQKITNTINAVPPSPKITLIPYSHMYCGVKYKANGTLIKHRAENNSEVEFVPVDGGGTFNDTETTIHGASEISSLCDMSALYCSVVDVSNATKLSSLQVGNDRPGYCNTMLREISFGANNLLRSVDLTNCERLNQAIRLSQCPNIETIKALGTSITNVELPEAGYVKNLQLPNTIDSLLIVNHTELETKNLLIGRTTEGYSDTQLNNAEHLDTSNITDLCIAGCNLLNGEAILDNCLSNSNQRLQYVRITNIEWYKTVKELRQYYKTTEELNELYPGQGLKGYNLRGIDDDGNHTEDFINITGNCYLNEDVPGDLMAELKQYFKFLDFVMLNGHVVKSTVTFMNDDGDEVLAIVDIESTKTEGIRCPDPVNEEVTYKDKNGVTHTGKIDKPVRATTPKYSYEWEGWSRQSSKVDRDTDGAQSDALMDIAGDRILYPTFKSTHRTRRASFFTGEYKLYDVDLRYDEDIVEFNPDMVTDSMKGLIDPNGKPYNGAVDISSRTYFSFVSWYPEIGNKIYEDTIFVATFTIDRNQYHTATIDELRYNVDYDKREISIYGYVNGSLTENLEPVVLIAPTYEITRKITNGDGEEVDETATYKVVALKANQNTTGDIVTYETMFNGIEVLALPETVYTQEEDGTITTTPCYLTTIGYKTFYNQEDLYRVEISDTVTKVEAYAFSNCDNLREVDYNAKNATFESRTSALESDPLYYAYPFDKNHDLRITVGPDVVEIPSDSFTQYTLSSMQLLDLTQAQSLININRSAFSNCNFNEIRFLDMEDLDSGIKYVKTIGDYAFANNNKIDKITIPNGVERIGLQAFGNYSKLKEVYIPNTVKVMNAPFVNTPLLDTFNIEEGSSFTYNIEDPSRTLNGLVNYDSTERTYTLVHGRHDTILGNEINKIGNHAFNSNSLIESITIPGNVSEIGQNAFGSCTNLKTVNFMNNTVLKVLSQELFSGCTKLTSINIPNSVTTIKNMALDRLSITKLSLPSSLTTLELYPIRECRLLTHIDFKCTKEPSLAVYNGKIWVFSTVPALQKVRFNWKYKGVNEVTEWGCPSNVANNVIRFYTDKQFKGDREVTGEIFDI